MQGTQLALDITPTAPPAPPPPPPRPYSVRLRDSELGQRERFDAETRFARALEDRLGTPEKVRDLLGLLQDAEYQGRALTDEEQQLALTWKRAHQNAREAALQSLAAITGAWFEVTV